MLKTIIFVVIAIALSAFAAMQFAAQLESASATRARRDEDNVGRSLELGTFGRAVIALIFAVVMILLGLASKLPILSTIIALLLSGGLVLANTYLKRGGINALPSFFLLWVGILISSIKDAGFTSSNITLWGKIYIVLQIVALVLLVVGTILGNILAYTRRKLDEDDKADELEAEVAEAEAEVVKETPEASEDAETVDEDDDEDNPYYEEDPFHEKFWSKAIWVGGIVIVIILAIVIGYMLEANFDFFPPYNI